MFSARSIIPPFLFGKASSCPDAPRDATAKSPTPRGAPVDDDNSLLTRIRQDDVDALGLIYDRYAPDVFALCIHLLGEQRAAEALLDEVFISFWQRRRRLHVASGRLRLVLLGMAQIRGTASGPPMTD